MHSQGSGGGGGQQPRKIVFASERGCLATSRRLLQQRFGAQGLAATLAVTLILVACVDLMKRGKVGEQLSVMEMLAGLFSIPARGLVSYLSQPRDSDVSRPADFLQTPGGVLLGWLLLRLIEAPSDGDELSDGGVVASLGVALLLVMALPALVGAAEYYSGLCPPRQPLAQQGAQGDASGYGSVDDESGGEEGSSDAADTAGQGSGSFNGAAAVLGSLNRKSGDDLEAGGKLDPAQS